MERLDLNLGSFADLLDLCLRGVAPALEAPGGTRPAAARAAAPLEAPIGIPADGGVGMEVSAASAPGMGKGGGGPTGSVAVGAGARTGGAGAGGGGLRAVAKLANASRVFFYNNVRFKFRERDRIKFRSSRLKRNPLHQGPSARSRGRSPLKATQESQKGRSDVPRHLKWRSCRPIPDRVGFLHPPSWASTRWCL